MNEILIPTAELEPEVSPEPAPSRIPHFGHAIIFVFIAIPFLVVCVGVLMFVFHATNHGGAEALTAKPKLSVVAEGLAYLLTLGSAWLIFPLLWNRPFLDGIQWNFAPARRLGWRLVLFGIFFGWTAAVISGHLPHTKDSPIEKLFDNAGTWDLWLLTIFGTLLGPLFEEICFRGFLLPAFAVAWEWLSYNRNDPAAVARWGMTDSLGMTSLTVASVVSSLLFMAMHAPQVAHSISALSLLFCVSLVLSFMRLRYRSVAVSYVLHASYNFSIFLGLMIATGGYRHLDRVHP